MLILHTADLHLGKTLHERDLLPDQVHMLRSLSDAIAARRPALLLIAGDVYDRSIPPPAAIEAFDAFLGRALDVAPDLVVVVIPGNHDSAARLSFGAGLLSRAGVHIRTRAEDCVEPIVVERGGERISVWALPFLSPGAFSGAGASGAECQAPRSQAELFAIGIRLITSRMDLNSRNVLLAHCFAAGGATSESERTFVGLAEQVDASALAAFDYAALGHLHRRQEVGARGRYPGSPLAYSFGESAEERGFMLAEIGPDRVETEFLPVRPLHPMRRIEGPFSELAAPGAFADHREAYVEARLTDSRPVLNPSDPLRANFPNLLAVRQAAFEIEAAGPGQASLPPNTAAGGVDAALADFAAFHTELRGKAPEPELAAAFSELLAEAERAAI